jgi:hypothetical protein
VRYWIRVFILMSCLVLSACSTMIQSEVTAFHEWPQDLQDKSFVFVQTREQENNLEYRNYQNLLRAELQRLGFSERASAPPARLKVEMEYRVDARDVREVAPVAVDPWYGPGFYGPYWPYYGYYHPFYYPYWYGPPMIEYRENRYRLFSRQLQIGITRASDGKKLYDVTVNSQGTNSSLAAVMPYMIRSAFEDFPGPSGVPRKISLKMED